MWSFIRGLHAFPPPHWCPRGSACRCVWVCAHGVRVPFPDRCALVLRSENKPSHWESIICGLGAPSLLSTHQNNTGWGRARKPQWSCLTGSNVGLWRGNFPNISRLVASKRRCSTQWRALNQCRADFNFRCFPGCSRNSHIRIPL